VGGREIGIKRRSVTEKYGKKRENKHKWKKHSVPESWYKTEEHKSLANGLEVRVERETGRKQKNKPSAGILTQTSRGKKKGQVTSTRTQSATKGQEGYKENKASEP